jgi:hypothetical protein
MTRHQLNHLARWLLRVSAAMALAFVLAGGLGAFGVMK